MKYSRCRLLSSAIARGECVPVILVAAAALLLGGCTAIPVTNRSTMNLVDHDSMVKIGTMRFENEKRQQGVSREREPNEQLKRVVERLAPIVLWDIPDADWEYVVLATPDDINASAMAGGKITITSGFWRAKVIQNDAQLAWVIAHEMGHLAAKHLDARMSRALVAQGGTLAAIVGLGAAGGLAAAQTGAQAYQLSAVLATLSFDRDEELEADYMGMIYMARAGYNPEEAVRVFERMEQGQIANGKLIATSIFSTHPSHPARILALMDKLPKAQAEYNQSAAKVAPVIVR